MLNSTATDSYNCFSIIRATRFHYFITPRDKIFEYLSLCLSFIFFNTIVNFSLLLLMTEHLVVNHMKLPFL